MNATWPLSSNHDNIYIYIKGMFWKNLFIIYLNIFSGMFWKNLFIIYLNIFSLIKIIRVYK